MRPFDGCFTRLLWTATRITVGTSSGYNTPFTEAVATSRKSHDTMSLTRLRDIKSCANHHRFLSPFSKRSAMRRLNGAMIEAINLGENRLKVTVTNVSRCTLWLHSAMVDFEKPIQVTVNGEPCFDALVTPSLVTALESFERRRDWGLVYPAKITLDTNGNGSARLPDDVPLDGTAFEEHVGPTFSQTSRDYR